MDTPKNIGERIRQQRVARNVEMASLAKAAGITVSALSQIELGQTKFPRAETLFLLADALDVEARWLVFGNHNRVAPSLRALTLTETGKFRVRHNVTTEKGK